MSRLPTPGGDNGNWGAILNDYLSQEHNADGSLKIRTEGIPATIADGSITASKLSSSLNSYIANAQTAVQSVNGKTGQAVTLTASDIADVVADSEKGAANGVATLDGTSKLTSAQLPSSVVTASDIPALALSKIITNQGNGPYWCDVRASDDVLFVAVTNDQVVKAFDISDPANPTLLDSVSVGTGTADLHAHGNLVYVTDQNGLALRVIDATDPENLSVLTTYTYDASGASGGGRFAINTDGDLLLIGGPESGANDNKAHVVDVSTPASPSTVGTTAALGGTHRGVAYIGNDAFAVASRDDHTIRIVSVATPASPSQVATITTVGTVTTPLEYADGLLYAGCYGSDTGSLEVFGVSAPASPTTRGTVTIVGGSEQIALTGGGVALVACRSTASLVAVDVSDPDNLTILKTVEHPNATTTPGVAYHDGYAYATAAGDTSNGKLFVYAVQPTFDGLTDAQASALAAVEAAAAKLAGNQTLTGTQTIDAATALILSNSAAKIRFNGTDTELYRTGSAALRADVTLRLLALLLYPSDATVARAFGSGSDSQPKMLLETDGLRWGPGGSTAPDVRLNRGAANRLDLLTAAFRLGASDGKGFVEMVEQSAPPSAPSANGVRLYAEDNGSGKTRLMALFASGAAQQVAIEP